MSRETTSGITTGDQQQTGMGGTFIIKTGLHATKVNWTFETQMLRERIFQRRQLFQLHPEKSRMQIHSNQRTEVEGNVRVQDDMKIMMFILSL